VPPKGSLAHPAGAGELHLDVAAVLPVSLDLQQQIQVTGLSNPGRLSLDPPMNIV